MSPGYSSQSVSSSSNRFISDLVLLFRLDYNAVYKSLTPHNSQVSILGGSPLDMSWLQREAVLLGQLRNSLDSHAFRVDAQSLELPVTCVRTAYGLERAYKCLFYHHEQCFVFGCRLKNEKPVKNQNNFLSNFQKRGESGRKERSKRY